MKKIIFIIFFMLISSISVAEVFTLTDCINLAKEHNLELQQARLSIANARAAASEARAQFYPSLGVSSSYRLSGDFSGNNNYQGNFSNGVNASYNLYKGGAIRASAKIADYRLAIAQENYRQKEAEVILAVKQAFYKILQIQQQIDLIKQVLQRRHENLVLIKLNYNVGRENQANVAQAEANLSQSEYDYWKAQQNLALAKADLAMLLNQNDTLIEIKLEQRDENFAELDILIAIALQERAEITAERLYRDILENQLLQAKSNYLPALAISSSYGLGGENFLEQKASWSGGVNLSWSLFNGFANKAKVRQAKVSLEQEDLKLKSLENNIKAEVRQAYTNWQLAKKNLEVNERILKAMQDVYQLTKLQYEQGRTSYYFLQQKESELSQAENNSISALFNVYQTAAILNKVLGRSN